MIQSIRFCTDMVIPVVSLSIGTVLWITTKRASTATFRRFDTKIGKRINKRRVYVFPLKINHHAVFRYSYRFAHRYDFTFLNDKRSISDYIIRCGVDCSIGEYCVVRVFGFNPVVFREILLRIKGNAYTYHR